MVVGVGALVVKSAAGVRVETCAGSGVQRLTRIQRA